MIDGNINDAERKIFIQNHIAEILKARNEGVRVNGYLYEVSLITSNCEKAITPFRFSTHRF